MTDDKIGKTTEPPRPTNPSLRSVYRRDLDALSRVGGFATYLLNPALMVNQVVSMSIGGDDVCPLPHLEYPHRVYFRLYRRFPLFASALLSSCILESAGIGQ